jgi:L-ascorbate metabolism protein UlaG (beta-lactamase superfamily)/pimeloyl-ACP methyl ester carboxylesterase
MKPALACLVAVFTLFAAVASAQTAAHPLARQTTIEAAGGPIVVSPIMHASVQIEHGGRVIQVDPAMGDQSTAKPADLVVVTDIHEDHLNPSRIARLRKAGAPVVVPAAVRQQAGDTLPAPVEVLANGQTKTVAGFAVEAVPMYNVEHKAGDVPYHTKRRGNGYVITVGGKRLYFAGDTECVPEIKALASIDVAFLPMNLPFTMSPAEAADCAKAFKPKVVIPYHFQGHDIAIFEAAVNGSRIEVRMLDWYPVTSYPDTVAIERPGSLVDVGGRKLHINCTGGGQPTVVLEGGGPAFAIDWMLVQPDIAKTTRVCSYDRAGFGWSDPSGRPESVDGAVADLHALLQAAGEKPPFVMVGAQLGGIYARAYHLRYPGEAVGFVFVDALHEDAFVMPVDGKPSPAWRLSPEQFRAAVEAMIPKEGMPPQSMNPSTDAPFDKLPPDVLRTRITFELRALKALAALPRDQIVTRFDAEHAAIVKLHAASANQPLGAAPLVVLTPANVPDPGWKAMQEQLARLSSNASSRSVATPGGDLNLSNPAAVVRAVGDVITAVRQGGSIRH